MNQKFSNETKWGKELEKEITKYKYAKKVFLDSENNSNKEKQIIKEIQKILKQEGIFDETDINNLLTQNKVLKYNNEVNFIIRKINYYFEESIIISNCVIIFLFNEKNEFFKTLSNLENNVTTNGINLEFSSYKSENTSITETIHIVNELSELGIDKNELKNFFEGFKILYSGEIKIDEIRKLREFSKYENTKFIIPTIRGILLLLVSKEEFDVDTVSTIVKDAIFYVGGKSDTNIICKTKIDKDSNEPKAKVILTI